MTGATRDAIRATRETIASTPHAAAASASGRGLTPRRSRASLIGRAALGAALGVVTLAAHLADDQDIGSLAVLLAIVAAALLVLTRSPWWRIAAGLLLGWCISVGASLARAGIGAVLSQPWAPGRAPPAAQTFVDLVFGVVGLVASTAVLLGVSGALRIRRR